MWGSGDINGNNCELFKNCSYEGNDVIKAKNVTIVSRTKNLSFNNCIFDTIVSTECFEHEPEYKESFLKMLKPDGLFFLHVLQLEEKNMEHENVVLKLHMEQEEI